jgi:hypothetical protein
MTEGVWGGSARVRAAATRVAGETVLRPTVIGANGGGTLL